MKLIRYFHNRYLLTNPLVCVPIGVYYTNSPPKVDFIAKYDNLRVAWLTVQIDVALRLALIFLITHESISPVRLSGRFTNQAPQWHGTVLAILSWIDFYTPTEVDTEPLTFARIGDKKSLPLWAF